MGNSAPTYRRPLSPQEEAARAQKSLATTRARGETLWFDGYSMTPSANWGVYTVTTPERINRKTGEVYVIDYTVDIMGQTCNCVMFERANGKPCKHLIGADKAIVAAQEALRAASAILTPSPTAAPVVPRPMPQVPAPYTDTGASRWKPDNLPPASRAAIDRAGVLSPAADY